MDHDVFLVCHLVVSRIDLVLDPVRELVLENGGTHVGDPLLGSLGELKGRLRQVVIHMRMVVVEEVSDLFDS